MSGVDLTRELYTSESKAIMNTLLGWAKTDRESTITASARDITMFRDTRTIQSTYTRDETIALLDSVSAAVRAAVSDSHAKLIDSTGSLVRAVLAAADAQRVELGAIDALSALNEGRNATAQDIATQKMLISGPNSGAKGGLAPLAPLGGGAGGETEKQLQQANELIKTLRTKLHAIEDQYRKVMDEKSRLTGANMYLGDQLTAEEKLLAQERQNNSSNMNAANAQSQKTAAQLTQELEALRDSHRKEVQTLSKKVSDLQKEQAGKLSESSQFQAMKKMLREKTDQVKKLRDLLRPYNPQAAAGGDDDIATDEDDD